MKKKTVIALLLICLSMILGSCVVGGGADITLPPYTEEQTSGVNSPLTGEPTGTGESTDTESATSREDVTTSVPPVGETTTEPVTSSPEQTTEANTNMTPDGYGLVPESPAVDKSFFNDVAFIGDSVSLKLKTYCMSGSLGKAQFFAVGSFSLVNALTPVSANSCHPTYQGEKMLAEDCVLKSGARKVYIMLGMNDLIYGVDSTVGRYKQFVDRILKKCPDVEIYVQSMTPMMKNSSVWGNSLNNDKIREYNAKLLEKCKEYKWYYVDVFSVMWDSASGQLRADYCSDPGPSGMGMHMTSAGCKAWVEYLLTHTVK